MTARRAWTKENIPESVLTLEEKGFSEVVSTARMESRKSMR